MTRNEVMVHVIPAIRSMWDNETCDEILEALSQEPILDKIRAEIEEQKENRCFDYMFAYIITGLDDALEIIDKYKAESEDKECK